MATLVIDAQGRTVGADGTSKSIGNQTDLQLLLALRSKATVIVTTGQTARAESYRASRFAPIAIITSDPESLATLPLLENAGAHETLFLSSNLNGPQAFTDFEAQLKAKGFGQVLFEGGPKSLASLLDSELPATLVLSIANFPFNEHSEPTDDDLHKILGMVLPGNKLDLLDAYRVGPNLVVTWSRPRP